MNGGQEMTAHNQAEVQILQKLESFLPERIFDAHAHLYNPKIQPDTAAVNASYGMADAERFFAESKCLYGERKLQAMFLPWPTVSMRDSGVRSRVNIWMAQQLEYSPGCAAEAYVLPEDTAQDVKALLIHPGIRGFKCYYTSRPGNDGESDIAAFLPESAWQVANERGLCITLHMMKTLSPADPVNLAYIQEKTAQYPNAKLILAHCGRGFAGWTILETARKLKGIANVYYDLAAIAEPAQMFEVIRQAGADHVLWGTDHPLTQLYNRPFSVGMGSVWLDSRGYAGGRLGVESLFAFYQAAQMLELKEVQTEAIFYRNAVELFRLAT